jgi:hypothetical protein
MTHRIVGHTDGHITSLNVGHPDAKKRSRTGRREDLDSITKNEHDVGFVTSEESREAFDTSGQ